MQTQTHETTATAVRPFRVDIPEENDSRPAPAHRRDGLAREGDSSPMIRKACNWRQCRRSRATGAATTTSAGSRRS